MSQNKFAPKVTIKQVAGAAYLDQGKSFSVDGVDVGRVWLQGTVAMLDLAAKRLTLDDGSGRLDMLLDDAVQQKMATWHEPVGRYIMVVGQLKKDKTREDGRVIRVRKVGDLTEDANVRAEMWDLEVEELWDHVLPERRAHGLSSSPPRAVKLER